MIIADDMNTEPTLRDVIFMMMRARRHIFTGAVIGGLFALVLLLAAVPHYRASIIVGPTTRTGAPDIAALFPENASYALEYVLRSFGPGDSSDFTRFENILREPSVATRLLTDEKIRAGIKSDRDFRISPGESAAGRPETFAAYLQKKITVDSVPSSPLRRIVYWHPDRDFAIYMLDALYREGDTLIREEVERKTENRVKWLGEMLDQTSNPEHRRALTSLLMEQEQVRMILALKEPFAAMIAEPASAGPKPAWPRPRLFIPIFILVGAGIGFAFWTASKKGF